MGYRNLRRQSSQTRTRRPAKAQANAGLALTKVVVIDGLERTVMEHIDMWHARDDLTVATCQQSTVKPMSHQEYLQASEFARLSHAQRMRKGGCQTVFLVNNKKLGKLAYEYAKQLLEMPRKPPLSRDLLFAARAGANHISMQEISSRISPEQRVLIAMRNAEAIQATGAWEEHFAAVYGHVEAYICLHDGTGNLPLPIQCLLQDAEAMEHATVSGIRSYLIFDRATGTQETHSLPACTR